MPSKTLTLASFRYGLDNRRDSLVENPGTLASITNAHINNGGELEKRLACIDQYNSISYTNTFGLLGVRFSTGAEGFVVFADAAASVDAGLLNYPLFSLVGSTGIQASVFRCKHPVSAFGGSGSPTMNGLKWVVNFSGFPLVCATFTDGTAFLYYGGSPTPANPIDASAMGLVYASLTAGSNLATQLAGFISGNNGAGLVGWTATATSNYVDVKTPVGITATYSTLTTNDPSQTISVQHISDSSPGTPGSAPSAALTITAVGNTGDAWTAKANGVQAGQYTVLANDTIATVCAGIVASINSTVPGSGPKCTASTDGKTVFCYGPVGNTSLNTTQFDLSSNGTGTIGAAPPPYATTSVDNLFGQKTIGSGTTLLIKTGDPGAVQTVVATPYGLLATPVPSYLWTFVSGSSLIQATNPTGATTAFRASVPKAAIITAIFNCVITGGSTSPLTTNSVTVTLECDTTN